MAVHIFKDGDHRAKGCDGVPDVRPKVSLIFFAFPAASVTERLARVAARENINRRHVGPVDCLNIAKVWHAWIVRCQNCAGVLVNFRIPDNVSVVEILHRHIKPAVAGK